MYPAKQLKFWPGGSSKILQLETWSIIPCSQWLITIHYNCDYKLIALVLGLGISDCQHIFFAIPSYSMHHWVILSGKQT